MLHRTPKNDVERSVHEWSNDTASRDSKLGHVHRLPTKPKRWIHGRPEQERWYNPATTDEQRQQWRQYYDNLVITGHAKSQPPDSWYEQNEANKVYKQRQLNQQKYMSPPTNKRQKTNQTNDSQHTEIDSPVSSDIEDIDDIIQQHTQV